MFNGGWTIFLGPYSFFSLEVAWIQSCSYFIVLRSSVLADAGVPSCSIHLKTETMERNGLERETKEKEIFFEMSGPFFLQLFCCILRWSFHSVDFWMKILFKLYSYHEHWFRWKIECPSAWIGDSTNSTWITTIAVLMFIVFLRNCTIPIKHAPFFSLFGLFLPNECIPRFQVQIFIHIYCELDCVEKESSSWEDGKDDLTVINEKKH